MSIISLSDYNFWLTMIEIYICYATGVAVINFIYTDFVPKTSHVLFAALVMTIISSPAAVLSFPLVAYVQLVFLAAIMFVYIQIMLLGTFSCHLFWTTTLLTVAIVVNFTILTLLVPLADLINLPDVIAAALGRLLTSAAMIVFATLTITRKLFRKEDATPSPFLIIVALWQWVSAFFLVYFAGGRPLLDDSQILTLIRATTRVPEVTLALATSVTIVAFHYLFVQQLIRNRNLALENSYARLERSYISGLEQATDELRRLRHDFRNHVIAFTGLVDKGDLAAMSEYLAQFQTALSAAETHAITGNNTLDAILNVKLEAAKKKNISVDLKASSIGIIAVDNFSIATIAGNLLDNAIEASERLQKHGKDASIQITIKKRQENFLLVVSNLAFAPERQLDTFVTTKRSDEAHGLGLYQVRRWVNDCNGILDIVFEPGVTVASAEIPPMPVIANAGVATVSEPASYAPKSEKPGVSNTQPEHVSRTLQPEGQKELSQWSPVRSEADTLIGQFIARVYLPIKSETPA